jgi:cytochrome d ubiquinol oxidase subunit I
MCGALVTGVFVMCGVGAWYLLEDRFVREGRVFLKVGVVAGIIACAVQIFPTGDLHGRYLADHQPVTMAAMEGLFRTEAGAPIVLIGQPDAENERIDNPLLANSVLSLLIYGTPTARVKGLNEYPKADWPTNIPLLYYAYHIMAGLGTLFILVIAGAAFLLWRESLFRTRWMLWILLLATPLPYIANTAGWMTAEIGRQPWVVYGLMRTADGYSKTVNAGNALFTLLGFMGLYLILGILFLFLVSRAIGQGPEPDPAEGQAA